MHEPRRRFALSGQHFSAPAERGTRTAQACSSLTDGEFFAEIQRGVALCGAREIAAPAAGTAPYPRRWAKRKGHLRFPFLFELLPFPYLLVWRRLPTCDRSETENGRGFFLLCLSQPVRSVRYCTATHVVKSTQSAAQGELPEGQEKVPWGIAVPHNSLARYVRQGLRG